MSTEVENARDIIEAVRKGVGPNDLRALISLQEWSNQDRQGQDREP